MPPERPAFRNGTDPRRESGYDAGMNPERTAHVPHAAVDVDRARRCGFPEVVYAPGKSPETVAAIFERLVEHHGTAFATRVDAEQAAAVVARFAEAVHEPLGRTLRIGRCEPVPGARVAVVSAGTTDLPVALEAVETLHWMGCETTLVEDVGVAGPQRLPERMGEIAGADAVVVVAGMEGALPSVVGGWLDCPVIAVPTSVGYGANFGGLAALLGMLNSCAANVTVVNIDAGFKAAHVAGLIATRAHPASGGR
jgi:pyridinium-3,5-biscarboxylic acid mononucleotide synthase